MNQQNFQNNNQPSFKTLVSDAMKKRLERLLLPPEKPVKDVRPKNNLWIAYVAFNVLLAFLDIITAITVGTFTLWFYGVLVFGAGYGPLLLWEFLFVRPYASRHQKWAAIAGAVIGAFSTVGIGILVAILNVAKINTMFGAGTIEMIIIVSMVVLTASHIVLFGVYYFIDLGFQREQNFAVSLANHDDTVRAVRQAKLIASELLSLGEELETEKNAGRGALVGLALNKLGTTNLLDDELEPEKVPFRSNGNHP